MVVSRVNSDDPGFGSDTVGILVECYAIGSPAAEKLANASRTALKWSAGRRTSNGGFIRWWDESSRPVEFSNPDVNRHVRFQFTGTLCIALK